MIEQILNKLFKLEIISRNEGEDYIHRWHLLKTPWFKIYLHKFCGPDEDLHGHDHPWNSWIFMLKGGYWEDIYDSHRLKDMRLRTAPSLRRMPAETIHSITKLTTPTVWTLFAVGKKIREWGFHTPKGWIPHKEYLKEKDV